MHNGSRIVMMSGLALAAGLVMGVAIGLLLAPRPGSHTRRQLRSLADDIGEHVSRMAEEATEAANEVIEHGKCLAR